MAAGKTTRRDVIASIGVGGLAIGAAGGAFAQEAESKLTIEQLACAEPLIGTEYTEAEREQALRAIDDQLEALRTLAKVEFENALAPATVFDPRLAGFTPPAQRMGKALPDEAPTLPSDPKDIAFAPTWHHAHWLRSRRIKSAELVEIYLDRIGRYAPKLENFVTVTADLARRQAAAADKEIAGGRYRGPLHGVPYGLKDLIDTAGIKTTWGAETHKDRVPESDAYVTKALEDAGAVLLGKTTNGAIAYGDIWFGGRTRNPWNPEEGSSGSSAGTGSAVAAGLISFGIGTETLGSIVSPSNRNGVTGLRPTFGRVARTGAMALCWSLDKIGPMCRNVWDTALVLKAINGKDAGDVGSIEMPFGYDVGTSARGMRLGYDPAWFDDESVAPLDRDMLQAARDAGLTLVEVTLPELPVSALTPIVLIEAAAAFEELTLSNRDDLLKWQEDQAWPNSWRTIRYFPAVSHVQIERLRRRVMNEFAGVIAGVDALGHPNYAAGLLLITNMTGHPTLALRAGFIEQPTRPGFTSYLPPEDVDESAVLHRVPRAASLTGHLFDEGRLLSIGAAIERELGVWSERPTLG